MHAITILFQLFLTYFLSSIVVFQAFSRIVKPSASTVKDLLIYTLGLGPMTVAWMLALLLWCFPHHSNQFYLCSIDFFILLPFFLLRKQLSLISEIQLPRLKNIDGMSVLLLAGIALVFAMMVFHSLCFPFIGNDQLEYASIARRFYFEKSVVNYPILDINHTGGIVAPFTHPISYITLFTWQYMIAGKTEAPAMLGVVSISFSVYTLFAIFNFVGSRDRFAAIISAFLLITTPLYFLESAYHHIDSLRIYTFLLVFIYLTQLVKSPTMGFKYVLAYVLGMSLFSHSINILTMPLFGFIYFVLAKESYLARTKTILLVLSLGIVFVIPRYYINLHTFGSLISDNNPVWDLPNLHYAHALNIIRGLSLPSEKIVFGLLKGLSKINIFGGSYWLLLSLPPLIYFLSQQVLSLTSIMQRVFDERNLDIVIILMVLACFYGMAILSVVLGMNIFIKNDRYFLTVHPFIVICCGYLVANVRELLLVGKADELQKI